MKRYLAIMLAVLLAVTLVACGETQPPPAPDIPVNGDAVPDPGVVADNEAADIANEAEDVGDDAVDFSDIRLALMVSAFGDLSFNDNIREGLERLEVYGFQVQYVEVGTDPSRADAFVLDIIDMGTDILINHATYTDQVEAAAREFPDMRFIIYDTPREIANPLPNVHYINYAQNEGSYLVGMIAAAVSESGVISTLGGMQNPVIQDFMVGYMAGARAYNPDIKVVYGFMGNWTDTAMMQELFTSHFHAFGADVVYPLSGNAGIGAFEAALSVGAYGIGVDSDMYALFYGNDFVDVIVTSMLKEIGNSIYAAIMRIMDGEDLFGTAEMMGIATGSVGFVDNAQFRGIVPAGSIARVEAEMERVISGEVRVPSFFDFDTEQEFVDFANSFAP